VAAVPGSADKVFPLAQKATTPIYRNSSRVKVPRTLLDPNLVRYTKGTAHSDTPIALVGFASIGTATTAEIAVGYIMVHYDFEFNGIVP
jgi:hypothetical protein